MKDKRFWVIIFSVSLWATLLLFSIKFTGMNSKMTVDIEKIGEEIIEKELTGC